MTDANTDDKTGIVTDQKVKKPAMFAVLVHNDPFTPREFVVETLKLCFQKTDVEASQIMLVAHRTGVGVVAIYTFEQAETKVAKANKFALDHNKLLLFSVEEA